MGKLSAHTLYLKNKQFTLKRKSFKGFTLENFVFKGFTLIELIIVIAILALLIILGIWTWQKQILKGYDARRKTDIAQIKVAIEEYEKDHNCYPLKDLLNCNPGTGLMPYLSKIPCDPRTGKSYYYDYDKPTCPTWYRLYSTLENSGDSDIVGLIGPNGSYNYYSGSPNAPLPGVTSSSLYGCEGGVCVPIAVDQNGRGECDPNYSRSDCNGVHCADFPCLPWKK